MPARERAADRGARLGRRLVGRIGEDLRLGRIAAGLSQVAVAKALGFSRAKYGRLESDTSPNVAVVDLARALAVVGLELSARAYPAGSPVRDRAHMELLERFHELLSADFCWRTEVPLPNPGDLRSWDGLARGAGVRIGVECEMRLTDWQELDRRVSQKRRDGGVVRVMLLLANTRSNRAFLRDHGAAVAASFPITGRRAMAALAAGEDPGGDAMILL